MIVKKKKYLSNKELYKEIIISKALGNLTPAAANMLYLLCKRAICKFYYARLEDREDAIQSGMIRLLEAWRGFDEDKTDNAFAYMTEIFKRGVAANWKINIQKHMKVDSLDMMFDSEDRGGGINI